MKALILFTLLRPASIAFAADDDLVVEASPQQNQEPESDLLYPRHEKQTDPVEAAAEVNADSSARAQGSAGTIRYCRIQKGQRASGYGFFRKSFYNITTVVRAPGKDAELDFYNENEISSEYEAHRQLEACNAKMRAIKN